MYYHRKRVILVLALAGALAMAIAYGVTANAGYAQQRDVVPVYKSTEAARKAKEEAQAAYYREQVKKLQKEPEPKSFFDNPAAISAATAVLAALVTIMTFLINYRATLQHQKDTQFYEALKRFGDQDSPALRGSAAGLLEAMSLKGTKSTRYLRTSASQLFSGLGLEENEAVLISIAGAISRLYEIEADLIIRESREAQIEMQKKFISQVATYGARRKSINNIDNDTLWAQVAAITGYSPEVLFGQIQAHEDIFVANYTSASNIMMFMAPEQKADYLTTAHGNLQTSARHLQSSVKIYDKIFAKSQVNKRLSVASQGLMDSCFLVKANLTGADLTNFGLERAQLQGAKLLWTKLLAANLKYAQLQHARCIQTDLTEANLYKANLSHATLHQALLFKTKLAGAIIDKHTILTQTNWWEADFFWNTPTEEIDLALLGFLFQAHAGSLPNDRSRFHLSVSKYMEMKGMDYKK